MYPERSDAFSERALLEIGDRLAGCEILFEKLRYYESLVQDPELVRAMASCAELTRRHARALADRLSEIQSECLWDAYTEYEYGVRDGMDRSLGPFWRNAE